MANKQPFYHEVQILYTTTTGRFLSGVALNRIRDIIESSLSVVKGSYEILEGEPEPGDPADLM